MVNIPGDLVADLDLRALNNYCAGPDMGRIDAVRLVSLGITVSHGAVMTVQASRRRLKIRSAEALLRNTQSRTLLEKYRRKCVRSIGFGVLVSDPSRPFHVRLG